MKSDITYRRAQPEDMEWVFGLFKAQMKRFIEQTWGWDELIQHHSFMANIPVASVTIIQSGIQDIGAYSLAVQLTGHQLDILLLDSQWQRRGIGSKIMFTLMADSTLEGVPLRLSVLKINPAANFYFKLGFTIESEDQYRYRLIYNPVSALDQRQ